jgi:NDP-sugar pyrophosphorylase family protein
MDFIHHNMRMASNRKLEEAQSIPEECQAVILAGGRGTRLRPAFDQGPKGIAPVGNRPFLEYLLIWLRAAGIQKLVVCVGYKKDQIRDWLGDGSSWGLEVKYSEEKRLLGTAGALKLAEKLISSPSFLVLNGDSFLDVNLQAMYRFHAKKGALVTIAVARVRHSARYGTVQLDRTHQIRAFQEKKKNLTRNAKSKPHGSLKPINGGVYLMQKRFLHAIPPRIAMSLEKDIFPGLVGEELYGFVTRGYFIDIGVPSDFERAQTELHKRFRT